MLVFLIPLRHHLNSPDYARDWRLLDYTLCSVTNQTCDDFHVLVACSKVLPVHECRRLGKVTFHEVAFGPIAGGAQPRVRDETFELHVQDKARKRRALLELAQKLHPTAYMLMDADDFVSCRLVDLVCRYPPQPVTRLSRGWMLQMGFLHRSDDLARLCGSTVIVAPEFLHAHQHEDLYLGGQAIYREHPCREIPHRAVMYHIHGGNHGRELWRYHERHYETPLAEEICREFGLSQSLREEWRRPESKGIRCTS